jgi:hypothetical protein
MAYYLAMLIFNGWRAISSGKSAPFAECSRKIE